MSGGDPVTPRTTSGQNPTSAGTPRHDGPQASYTSDEQSFHKLFPQVPLNEKLVENYQCGLSRSKIVRVGRLYLTSLRLCFHSTFMKESLMIEWENIVDVEKKENFVFEAVNVKVNTGECHYFSAFVYGNTDQAHKMITMLWSVRKRYAGMQLNTNNPSGGSGAIQVAPLPPVAPHHPTVPVAAAQRHPRTESTSSIGSVGFETFKASTTHAVPESHGPPSPAPFSAGPLSATPEGKEEPRHEDALSNTESHLPLDRNDTMMPPTTEAGPASDVAPLPVLAVEAPVAERQPQLPPPSPQSSASNSTTPNNMSLTNNNNSTTKVPAAVVPPAASPPLPAPLDEIRVSAASPTEPLPVGTLLTATVPNRSNNSLQATSTPHRKTQSDIGIASPSLLAASSDQLDAETLALMQQDKQQQQLIRSQSPPIQSKAEKRAEKAIARASAATIAAATIDTPHEVLRHFPNVPKTERVVDTFQCSYVMGVHRIGKLYITSHYVLFSSLMYTDGVCIRITDVASIEKEQTIVILDGILFKMKNGQTHSFTSFVNRDAAFNILHHFFAAHKQMQADEPPTTSPTAAPIAAAENLVPPPSLLEDATAATGKPAAKTEKGEEHSAGKGNKKNKKDKKKKEVSNNNNAAEAEQGPMFASRIAVPSYEQLPALSSIDEFSKVSTDYGTGISALEVIQREILPDVQFKQGMSIFDIFRLIFDDGTNILSEYHASRQDTGQAWENWKPAMWPHGTHHHRTFTGQRTFTCTTIIRAVMAKACAFTEFQKFAFGSVNGSPHLIVQLSGQALGVMFSDAFRAETILIFSQPSPTNPTVTMKVKGHIQFLRSVWVKGKILDTALGTEMPECYRTLTSMIHRALADATPMAVMTAAAAATCAESDSEESDDGETAPGSPMKPTPSAVQQNTTTIAAPPVLVAAAVAAAPVAAPEAIPEPLKMVHAAITGIILLFALRGLWTSLLWFDSYAGNYDLMYAEVPPGAVGGTMDSGFLAAAAISRVGSQILHLLRPLVVIGLLLTMRHAVLTLGRLLLA